MSQIERLEKLLSCPGLLIYNHGDAREFKIEISPNGSNPTKMQYESLGRKLKKFGFEYRFEREHKKYLRVFPKDGPSLELIKEYISRNIGKSVGKIIRNVY